MAAAPTSQRDRPISFVLDGQGGMRAVNLAVRPEDLTRQDSSRVSVIQTLGGAWADNFGPGVPSITISGHTGWRPYADGQDGERRFAELRAVAYDGWHQRREAAVRAGSDPDEVKLTFADALDNYAVEVAPLSFTLRRSRSRPLLMQFHISMAVLTDQPGTRRAGDPLAGGSWLDQQLRSIGLDSLADSLTTIEGYLDSGLEWIDKTIATPVRQFMGFTAKLYRSVLGAARYVDRYASSLMGIASQFTAAGVNLFRTVGAITTLPGYAKARAMQLAGAYTNIYCVLRKALRQVLSYDDYSSLYGASNCSSTSGGKPLSAYAGTNPLQSLYPVGQSAPVRMSQPAAAGLAAIAGADPVASPMTMGTIGGMLRGVMSGVGLA